MATLDTKAQNKLIREIFQTVYQWGQVGVVVDEKSPSFQTQIHKLLGAKYNGVHKVGRAYLDCYIPTCKKKHLPF